MLLISILSITILSTAFATTQNDTVKIKEMEGIVYIKDNGKIKIGKEIKKANIKLSSKQIEVHFFIGQEKADIKADYYKSDTKNKIEYYNGICTYMGKSYLVDIIGNDLGLSGLIYNETRSEVIPFVLSKKLIDTKDTLYKLNKEIMFNPETLTDEKEDNQILSVPINKEKYLFYDGFTIPFVISAGSVEGYLYYQTNIETIYGYDAQFYAKEIEGIVNWNTGYDSLSIRNLNEPYGHLFATPQCPSRRWTTWSIDEVAYAEGQYTYCATVSYTLIVDGFPVLFWDSKTTPLP